MVYSPIEKILSNIEEHFRRNVMRIVRPHQRASKTDDLLPVVFPQRSNRAIRVIVSIEHSRVKNRRALVRVTALEQLSLLRDDSVGQQQEPTHNNERSPRVRLSENGTYPLG